MIDQLSELLTIDQITKMVDMMLDVRDDQFDGLSQRYCNEFRSILKVASTIIHYVCRSYVEQMLKLASVITHRVSASSKWHNLSSSYQ